MRFPFSRPLRFLPHLLRRRLPSSRRSWGSRLVQCTRTTRALPPVGTSRSGLLTSNTHSGATLPVLYSRALGRRCGSTQRAPRLTASLASTFKCL